MVVQTRKALSGGATSTPGPCRTNKKTSTTDDPDVSSVSLSVASPGPSCVKEQTSAQSDHRISSESANSNSSVSTSSTTFQVSSLSLHEDLLTVNRLMKSIKNCISNGSSNPKSSRAKKDKKSAKHAVNNENKVIEILDAIYALNVRVISKVEEMQLENRELKSAVEKFDQKEKVNSIKSYAAAVVAPGVPSVALTGGVRVPQGKPLEHRVDALEQDSLSTVAMVQGPYLDQLITAPSSSSAGSNFIAPSVTQFASHINSLVPQTVQSSSLLLIQLIGRDRKHLRISFVSAIARDNFIRGIKLVKPDGLFVNDYLTKSRSELLYHCRALKRNNRRVQAVYVRRGVIVCKVSGLTKAIFVESVDDLNNFRSSISGTPSDNQIIPTSTDNQIPVTE